MNDNPFWVLGLPPTATAAEVLRTGQKLLGMLEIGISSAAFFDSPQGVQPRTPEQVRQAMADLRDPSVGWSQNSGPAPLPCHPPQRPWSPGQRPVAPSAGGFHRSGRAPHLAGHLGLPWCPTAKRRASRTCHARKSHPDAAVDANLLDPLHFYGGILDSFGVGLWKTPRSSSSLRSLSVYVHDFVFGAVAEVLGPNWLVVSQRQFCDVVPTFLGLG